MEESNDGEQSERKTNATNDFTIEFNTMNNRSAFIC